MNYVVVGDSLECWSKQFGCGWIVIALSASVGAVLLNN